jgi:hypothetical protein
MTSTETPTGPENAPVEEHAQHDAPAKAPSRKGATPKKNSPKGQKTAKGSKAKGVAPKKKAKSSPKPSKGAPAYEASAPRPESKGAKILGLISRAKGATLAEIMEATQWQAHSVRGFLSTAGKKHQLKNESAKTEAGVRVYKISK